MALDLRVINKIRKQQYIPYDWGHSKKKMFSWIIARANMKLESWKEKLMSKAGKKF